MWLLWSGALINVDIGILNIKQNLNKKKKYVHIPRDKCINYEINKNMQLIPIKNAHESSL